MNASDYSIRKCPDYHGYSDPINSGSDISRFYSQIENQKRLLDECLKKFGLIYIPDVLQNNVYEHGKETLRFVSSSNYFRALPEKEKINTLYRTAEKVRPVYPEFENSNWWAGLALGPLIFLDTICLHVISSELKGSAINLSSFKALPSGLFYFGTSLLLGLGIANVFLDLAKPSFPTQEIACYLNPKS